MNIKQLVRNVFFLTAACFLPFMSATAFGSGFALMEQGVKELGTAYAGAAASAEDASTIFYNPAGLTRLQGSQVVGGVDVIVPTARFKNEGSLHVTGVPLTGGNGGNAGSTTAVPDLYVSTRLNDRLSIGLGAFTPFGLMTEYDSTWVGRYHAIKSDLKTLNINPTVAYRAGDGLSVGAGLDVQYVKAELSNAIDFGTIFAALGVPGMTPQGNDGFVTLKGDGWSLGWNMGVLYEFSDSTRTGLAYRSRIKQTVEGNASFSNVPSPNPTGRFLDTGITADATLPDSLSLSQWYRLTKQITIVADITWTNWSTFNELRVKFDNPAETDAVTTTEWKDTFRYSLGGVYAAGPWLLRTGVAYDKTPIRSDALSTPRIPDSDRTWVTLGLGYQVSDALAVNVGYAHIFVSPPSIRKTPTGEDTFRGGLSGTYEARVDIIGTDVTWTF